MKNMIMLMVAVLTGVAVFSQQLVPIDDRLRAKYSDEDLLEIQRNNPADIEYLNWFLDNAFVVKEIRNPESTDIQKLRYLDKETKMAGAEVTEYNPETFNVMECKITILQNSSNSYKIGNTGKVLVFPSREDLTRLFNEYRRMHYENK